MKRDVTQYVRSYEGCDLDYILGHISKESINNEVDIYTISHSSVVVGTKVMHYIIVVYVDRPDKVESSNKFSNKERWY